MAKTKKFTLDQKHVDYFNKVVPELIEAEKTVARIKGSKEWKRAYDYFGICEHRGLLKVRPTKENGYKIEVSAGVVQIDDIKEIVTPEQLEEIKKLLLK